jgi:nucleoside-triphosphatase
MNGLDVFGSPEILLASFTLNPQKMGEIYLVSASSGDGKTTWLASLAEAALLRGWRVGGVLSPAVFEQGVKTGISLENLATGERRLLARAADRAEAGGFSSSHTPGWSFFPAALEWGNQVLAAQPACDLLIIDELGPLEFRQGGGLSAAFDLLARGAYRLACLSVRPELLDTFQQRWPASRVIPKETVA